MIAEHPFLIDGWDFFIMFLAVAVRFVLTIKFKAKEIGPKFRFSKYFDSRHIIRWAAHLLSSFTFILFLPELYMDYIGPKYLPEFPDWTFTGDFLIGFAGYDLIKLGEKITGPIVEKFTGTKIDK